jgi:hypothetical protein
VKIAITGATGFIGRRLVRRVLDEGQNHQVVAFSRDALRASSRFPPEVQAVQWEPVVGPPPAGALDGAEAVFHLAGESVGQRWTDTVKARLRESRILSTRNLVAGIGAARQRPAVLVSGSAVGYYGSRGDEILEEGASPGTGFLAELCRDWEAEAARAKEVGVRVVESRTGIVLGPRGGALSRMLPPFKMFVGGPLGDGRQWMSWIHIDDLVGTLLHAVKTEGLEGPVNATAPTPVANAEFSRILGKVLSRPSALALPSFVLRGLLGEFAEVLLGGQRVIPRKLEVSGFRFRFPDLETALRDILS